MKARSAHYSEDGDVTVIDTDVPDPGPGEVQLRMSACGICSWDVGTCKLGKKMKVPAPPGHEGIGYITKVGPGVTGFEEGDRVAAGGFQTVTNRSTDYMQKLPRAHDLPDEYWMVEPVRCVVNGMDTCRLQVGDRVALIGCGFMGLMLAQLLARSPAGEVIAMDLDASRLDLAREYGIQKTITLADIPAEKVIEEYGKKADVVIDTSGSQKGLDLASELVRVGGLLSLFGWIKGDRASFDPTTWHLTGFTVVNSAPGCQVRDTFPVATELIANGMIDLKKLVTHKVTLDEYPALMKQIVAGDPGYIKGVVMLG